MSLRPAVGAVALALVCASCVTNRKIQYMQHEDVNQKTAVVDSVLRKYQTIDFAYRIQPQDVLSVQFQSTTENTFNFFQQQTNNMMMQMQMIMLFGELVDEQGEIRYPVVGKIKVAGLTVFEVEEKLQILANQYLDAPKVLVRLLNFRVTVLGEVNREGVVTSFNNRITLPEALAMAGGVGELANREQVKIIRQYGNEVEVAYVNLLDENLITSPFYYVHQNDILVVPPLRQRPFRRYFAQNFALLISSVSLVLIAINFATP